MPGYWSAVRRWLATASPVAVQVLTAAAVVAGALWISVRPGNQTLQLPASVMAGATLEGVRPSETGDVDPRLAAAVDALLARRGKATRTNNLALFLRDVSPELRAKQRRLFANMRAIEMAVTYRRAEPWDDNDAMQRFGPATGTFRVSMRYQLLGTRLPQAATDVGYTFTVRSGRLYLVDDNDLDQQLGAGRMPWDFGPITVIRRPSAMVIVTAGEAGLGERIATDTVQVAKRVRKLWPRRLQQPLIVAMADRRVLTGMPPTLDGGESAVVEPMPSPAIDGRPVGGWVVVKPDSRQLFNRVELAHVLVHLLPVRLGDEAPRWLAEGLAEYAGNQQLVLAGKKIKVTEKLSAVSKQALGELTALPADDAFSGANSTDSYDISWLAVDHLIKEVGTRRVTDFYLQVARRGYSPSIRERLLEEGTGFTEQDLVESLRSLAG
ncbi:MAG TPA: hypothetical protein VGD71_11210 [Kribbella sp.]